MSLTEPNPRRLSVVYQDISSLKPRTTNPRTHSKKQIAQIAGAIRRFGFTNPVLVDEGNGIVAGHGCQCAETPRLTTSITSDTIAGIPRPLGEAILASHRRWSSLFFSP